MLTWSQFAIFCLIQKCRMCLWTKGTSLESMIQMILSVIILLLLNSCPVILDSVKLKESIRYYAHLNIKKIWPCLCDLILAMFEKSWVYAGLGGVERLSLDDRREEVLRGVREEMKKFWCFASQKRTCARKKKEIVSISSFSTV